MQAARRHWSSSLSRVPWPWWLLWPWAAAWAAVWTMQAGQSWHYFAQGGQLLLGTGPGTRFQLYAAHPDLQIGPLALVVSALTQLLGAHAGEIVALTAMSLTGPLVLAGVWRLLPAAERPRRFRLLLAGLVFLPVWSELTTHFGHLDDLMALCFSVAAMHAVARRHPVWAGLAIAAAADSKPWAAAFVPLLLALPRRQWLTALAAFTGGLAVAWLPFLLADPRTLAVARFTIPNDPSSALRVLGVTAPRTPWWDRSAQLALGIAGGCLGGTARPVAGGAADRHVGPDPARPRGLRLLHVRGAARGHHRGPGAGPVAGAVGVHNGGRLAVRGTVYPCADPLQPA